MLYADFSEHCSISIGGVSRKNNWYETLGPPLGVLVLYSLFLYLDTTPPVPIFLFGSSFFGAKIFLYKYPHN